MTNNAQERNRQPQGRPTGGQFAAEQRTPSGLSLTGQDDHSLSTDALGGYRVRKLQTAGDGLMFTAVLTRDGTDVGHISQEGRGGATRVRFAGGPSDPEATRFQQAAERVTGEDGEFGSDLLVDRAVAAAELSRKRGTLFRIDGDDPDFWEGGAYRQVPAKHSRQAALAALRNDKAADRIQVWDTDAADFVPLQQIPS